MTPTNNPRWLSLQGPRITCECTYLHQQVSPIGDEPSPWYEVATTTDAMLMLVQGVWIRDDEFLQEIRAMQTMEKLA